MSKGKVKDYYTSRGYGNIIDTNSGETLSVYANYVLLASGETLQQGQEVEYDIEEHRGENWAVNVRTLSDKL